MPDMLPVRLYVRMIFPLLVGKVNGRAQSFYTEAEHQTYSSAECTELFQAVQSLF